jgi:broad specificity phosphatase PhoE
MELILMRHYKVDMVYEKSYDSKGFDEASIKYNQREVFDQIAPILPKYALYASQMSRAQQTAKLAFNKEPMILEGVHEVTMKSYKDTSKRYRTWWWELMARLQWRRNHTRPYETYNETMDRLERGLLQLIEKDESAIIVMHGLAMRYMVKVLKKHGFSGPRIIHAKNGQTFKYRR